jgi:hypothetical protein
MQKACDLSRGQNLITREAGSAVRLRRSRALDAETRCRFHHQKEKQIRGDTSRTFWDVFTDVLGRFGTFQGTFG